jgi:hypothetical protein
MWCAAVPFDSITRACAWRLMCVQLVTSVEEECLQVEERQGVRRKIQAAYAKPPMQTSPEMT